MLVDCAALRTWRRTGRTVRMTVGAPGLVALRRGGANGFHA
jgi:hypothetical protein